MNKLILVTGGAGFIGTNFIHHWLKQYPEDKIICLDALTYAGNYQNLVTVAEKPHFKFIQGNILDQELVEQLLKEHKINTLVHFAAESHVDRSINEPDIFLETNIMGTYSLLKAARKVWLEESYCPEKHHFHHVSTDEVYGSLNLDDPAFHENTAYAPNSPYSASKAASDHLVRAYHHTYGLRVTSSNCSNNYGPYHFPEKLIPLVITNILHDKPLPVYGDGKQVRDWLYVEDHVSGIERILQRGKIGETYNIGGINEWTNIDLVTLICQLMDKQFQINSSLKKQFPNAKSAQSGNSAGLIHYIKDRPGHDRRYAIDPGKAEKELNYIPQESFQSGIAKTIDWYLNNQNWWQAVMDGSYRQWIEKHYE